ncbi:MAG: plastocyanin/azurin family copper-binding protein [Solirubrobacterales bacterium]|nr:plastocyanin/azurin family copper-binding protein [Solirubrobacterales bacterium]
MVPGRLISGGRLTALLVGLVALVGLAGLAPAVAGANSTRISLGDFKWSKDAEVNLGESVTWDFIGPDLQHSVTGQAPNATQWDSDPQTNVPFQSLGRQYRVTFDQPGTYLFVCKVHSSVRGTVTVSNTPGDPESDPGPPPVLNYDLDAPIIDDVFFTRDGMNPGPAVIGPRGKGIGLRFSIGERGIAEVDYYRLVPQYRWKTVKRTKRVRGRGGKVRVKVVRTRKKVFVKRVRTYAGYSEWQAHVGQNLVRFGARSATFPSPRSGQYVAVFRATDESANTTRTTELRFEIKPG